MDIIFNHNGVKRKLKKAVVKINNKNKVIKKVYIGTEKGNKLTWKNN